MNSRPTLILAFILCFFIGCVNVSSDKGANTSNDAEQAPSSTEDQKRKKHVRSLLGSLLKGKKPHALTQKVRSLCIEEGVDFGDIPMDDVLSNIRSNTWSWGRERGGARKNLWAPLYDVVGDSKYRPIVSRNYFRGLMESGESEPAKEIWSEMGLPAVTALEEAVSDLDDEGLKEGRNLEGVLMIYAYGFAGSPNAEDRAEGARLASTIYRASRKMSEVEAKGVETDDQRASAKMVEVLSEHALRALNFSLARAGEAENEDLNPLLAAQPKPRFRFQPVEDSGLGYSWRIAVGDVDADGYVDILCPGKDVFRNVNGTGRFEPMGLKMVKNRCGAIADLNNDGRPDIVTLNAGRPGSLRVFMQNADGTFRQLDPFPAVDTPEGIGLFDGDLDGYIDIYVACYEGGSKADGIFRGVGDGTFENVTVEWGGQAAEYRYAGRGVSPADYDGDGRTDVFVSNYRLCPNLLLHNRSTKGDAKLVDCALAPVFGDDESGVPPDGNDRGVQGHAAAHEGRDYFGHTIGSAWGDLDGDGRLDLVCANLAHPRYITMGFSDITRVYLNKQGRFEDHTLNAGIHFAELHADPLLADFDNDGLLDLSLTNTYKSSLNQFYVGAPGASFREITHKLGAFVFDGWGQSALDFDNDGDLDWLVAGIHSTGEGSKRKLVLFENMLIEGGKVAQDANYVQFKLMPKSINGMAYGARVEVTSGERIWVREVFGMRGTSSCDDQVVHVGLGGLKAPVDVTVRWSKESSSSYKGLAVNSRHTLRE